MRNGEMKILIKCERINFYSDDHQSKLFLMTIITILHSQDNNQRILKIRWKFSKGNILILNHKLKLIQF